MSWLFEGEMRSTPGFAFRASATLSETFRAGRWPPSPGFAPWPILISRYREEFARSADTPNRPDAICCPRHLGYLPGRSGSSPPSPLMQRMSSRFAASAYARYAVSPCEPKDIDEM